MSRPNLRVLSNLARSGGTLVSRCLGSMDGVVLLSEIHPLGMHYFNPLQQACSWYGLLQPGEFNDRRLEFAEAIQMISQRCEKQAKTLVIRDWAHLDYIGVPFLDKPAVNSSLDKVLAGSFDIIQTALVRHPLELWLSTRRLKVLEDRLKPADFLAAYRRYAQRAAVSGYMRFEDFTASPETEMQKLCASLQLTYDPTFIHRWSENRNVTGDVLGMSRGSRLAAITPLKKRPAHEVLLNEFRDNSDYLQTLDLLGYMD